MEFRLAIIPAGEADSPQTARELVATMRRAPEARTSRAVDEVLGALEGSGAQGYYRLRHLNRRGAMLESAHPEWEVLQPLLILAEGHGLAVYDIALNRLYDPTGAVDLEVSLPGLGLPFLTRELLADLVARPEWPDPQAPYLIVSRAEEDYIQAWLCDDGNYQLEYREGGPESHFMARSVEAGVVVDAMWAWATQDPSWRNEVDWWFVDLDAESSDKEDE